MDELREMLDQYAIEKVLKHYARALDEKNYDALDACFTADAVLDYTGAGGIKGTYAVVKAWLKDVLDPIPEMQHFTTNVEIVFDGDRATGTSYTLNVNGMRDETGMLQHMVVGAQYFDSFARTPKGWRITSRREARFCTFGHKFGPAPQVEG
ncbi:MAG: nuclear transport factor 2 family protein [Rhodospirillales bacterium]|nr:nuclear transport factor 2 family protein [Rhodospirillales bacterium]